MVFAGRASEIAAVWEWEGARAVQRVGQRPHQLSAAAEWDPFDEDVSAIVKCIWALSMFAVCYLLFELGNGWRPQHIKNYTRYVNKFRYKRDDWSQEMPEIAHINKYLVAGGSSYLVSCILYLVSCIWWMHLLTPNKQGENSSCDRSDLIYLSGARNQRWSFFLLSLSNFIFNF